LLVPRKCECHPSFKNLEDGADIYLLNFRFGEENQSSYSLSLSLHNGLAEDASRKILRIRLLGQEASEPGDASPSGSNIYILEVDRI